MERLKRAAGTEQLECASESLDLYSRPFMETSLDRCYTVEVNPLNSLASTSTSVTFVCQPSDDFTNLSESLVEVKMKLQTAAGGNLVAQDAALSYATVNLPAACVFSALNFKIQGQLISDAYSTYNYLAFIQTLLSYTKNANETRLRLAGYSFDRNPAATTAHAAAAASAFKVRGGWFALSKECTFLSPIFHEMCSQRRLLIPHVELSFEFIRASPAFSIITNEPNSTMNLEITSMKLLLRRQKVISSIKLQLEKELELSQALYPLTQATVKPVRNLSLSTTTEFFPIFVDDSLASFLFVSDIYRRQRGECNSREFVWRTTDSFLLRRHVDASDEFQRNSSHESFHLSSSSIDFVED